MDQKFCLFIYFLIINSIIVVYASSPIILKRKCTLNIDEGTQKFYDFRSLSLKSRYQTVKGNGSDLFLINICSTDNAFPNSTKCSKRTSICLIKDDNESFIIADVDSSFPKLDDNKNLILQSTMLNRFKLFDENCINLGTVIKLICNKTRPLEFPPTFEGRSNCTLNFEWQTPEACVDTHTEIESHFKNESLIFMVGNEKIDLEPIFKPQIITNVSYESSNKDVYDFVIARNVSEHVKTSNLKNKYTINLSKCDNSFVCQLKEDRQFIRSIAVLNNLTTLKHANDSFHLFVSSNSTCGRTMISKVAVIFNLYCGETNNITFVAENNLCHYIFDLYHPNICEYEKLLAKSSNKITNKSTSTTQQNMMEKSASKSTVETSNVRAEKSKDKIEGTSTNKPMPSKINQLNTFGSDKSSTVQSSSQVTNDSNSNTTLFGFIILIIVSVIGIVLAVVSLIDDDRRAWLQNRVRRVIKPQTAASFQYSQVNNQNSDSSRLVPLDQVDY